MNHALRTGLAASAVAALVASATVATAGAASAAAGTPTVPVPTGTLVVVEKETQSKDIDVAPAGPSLGDRNSFSGEIRKDGVRIGYDGGECSFTHIYRRNGHISAIAFQCVVTLRLQGGQITLQGLNRFGPQGGVFKGVITGGTGEYTGATGKFTVADITEKRSRITLDFGG